METKTATQMANLYGLKSSIAFNKLMVRCGILKDTVKGYVLADSLHGRGLIAVIDAHYFLPNGFRATKKRAAWTESGQHFIRQHLGRIGIVPVNEQQDLFNAN